MLTGAYDRFSADLEAACTTELDQVVLSTSTPVLYVPPTSVGWAWRPWQDERGNTRSARNDFSYAPVEGAMASIAILIDTPQNARLLAASSAREAALKAEFVIATIARADLPVPISVECTSPDMADRLMNYLADVQMERLLAEVA